MDFSSSKERLHETRKFKRKSGNQAATDFTRHCHNTKKKRNTLYFSSLQNQRPIQRKKAEIENVKINQEAEQRITKTKISENFKKMAIEPGAEKFSAIPLRSCKTPVTHEIHKH